MTLIHYSENKIDQLEPNEWERFNEFIQILYYLHSCYSTIVINF